MDDSSRLLTTAYRPGFPDRHPGARAVGSAPFSPLVDEAAVHHPDVVLRRTGQDRPLSGRWDDATAAPRGTGRERLTDDDRTELGYAASAFPLFG